MVRILGVGILTVFPLDASAAEQYVAVTVHCCGVTETVKVPARGLRGLGGEQIGLTDVGCKAFFEGATVHYAGGIPQEGNKGRAVDLGSVDKTAVTQKICKQLRDKGTVCCDILPFCEDNCQEMLAPNPNAARLFESLYADLADPNVPLTPANKLAISRFLSNCKSEELLNALANMPCPSSWNAPPGCKIGPRLKFKLRFRDRVPSDPEAGSVWPGEPFPNPDPEVSDPEAVRKFEYIVSVTNQKDGPAGERHAFPTPESACFFYTFSDGSSEMAKTLYHELFHIWWMNHYQTDYHNSGHGPDLGQCSNYDPYFVRKLRDFYRVMDGLEQCLKTNPIP
jgi:hypothetical protein